MKVLGFANGYLGSRVIHEIAQRHLESFSADVGESSSMSMLDDTDVVFVVRVPVNRVRAYMLALGERMPAYVTAQGRVLLAHVSDASLDRFFHQASLLPLTARTFTDESSLRAELHAISKQGWAMIDQKYEMNMRSIAAPVSGLWGKLKVGAERCTAR